MTDDVKTFTTPAYPQIAETPSPLFQSPDQAAQETPISQAFPALSSNPTQETAGWKQMSLRARVALLVAVAVGLAVALTSVTAYFMVRHELGQRLDTNLSRRAVSAVDSPLADPTRLVRVPAAALGAADVKIALIRADGVSFAAEGEAGAPPLGRPELAVAQGNSRESLRTARAAGGEYRVAAVPAGQNLALVLAQSTSDIDRELHRLGIALLVVGFIGVVGAATAGLAIARAGLRPIHRLTAAASHVARTEELQPVPVTGDDELARLAQSFNSMLGALQQSRQRQQQLVADASHELRTPLTSLRTNMDLLAQSARSEDRTLPPAERDALIADVRAQLEEMSGLVTDLLELARNDHQYRQLHPLDLADVVHQAVDRVRRRAPHLTFIVDAAPWHLTGDAALLERAIVNIVDNAATWSPANGTVQITLHNGILNIADEGPGISDADLPFVFDRFYRSDQARRLPGSGLGLAIARHAIDQHGGTITAQRAPRGALFVIWLPGTSHHADAQYQDSEQGFSTSSGCSQKPAKE